MKKVILSLSLSHTVCSLIAVCFYNTFEFYLYLYAFLPLIIIILHYPANYIIKNIKTNRSDMLYMINNFIILPVTAVCAILFWFNGKITDNINIDTVSTVPSVLFIILSVIIFLNFKYKSNYPEDKISYNMFENNLSTDELKIMYRESGLFMSGFLLPLFLLILYLDNSIKLISILLFFISVFGGFIYGSFKLRPLIISKRNKEKQELKEQLKKEQGYH